jgi:hypothetical protein
MPPGERDVQFSTASEPGCRREERDDGDHGDRKTQQPYNRLVAGVDDRHQD